MHLLRSSRVESPRAFDIVLTETPEALSSSHYGSRPEAAALMTGESTVRFTAKGGTALCDGQPSGSSP